MTNSFSLVCSNPSNPRVPVIRYDLQSDISLLDGESQLALMDLGLKWADRNRAEVLALLDLEPYSVDDGWDCLAETELAIPLTRKVTR